jgi:type VI secretion system protein ImpL
MKALFRIIWPLIGLVLIALIIWFIGPYLAVADFKPLESEAARILAISVCVLFWGIKGLLRGLKAQRASAGLVKQVVRQEEDPSTARASADARQLRQRFEEAISALQTSKGGRVNLYELPWYIIIGPPGSGKTTAIVNSGLNFPLAQKFGKEALRGVGGTRNCDWWFTDQAILLDTAGRYTTQDSDRACDAAGWSVFLGLLRKYRRRRPINGVLVAISVVDVATQSDSERAEHVASIRARLAEIDKQLKITLPVYLIFTKCDLLAGFSEFFDDLSQEQRSQVWGATFPLEVSRAGGSAQEFAAELDRLIERISVRVLGRMESERDVHRRALIFGFPNQLAGARRALAEFVSELSEGSAFEQRVMLRGVYFTSGTQEGMPIDRMLGALARTFGLGVRALNVQANRGKAYFIQRLLTEVVFHESGLAGVNRRLEAKQAAFQAASYIGLAMLAVLGVGALSVSYSKNQGFLQKVAAASEPLSDLRTAPSAGLATAVAKLEAYRNVLNEADTHRKDIPVPLRVVLYQGNSITNAARDAYLRELNSTLAPALATAFRDSIPQLASQPERLYEYLKAYLMLGQPQRLEPEPFKLIATYQLHERFPGDRTTVERLGGHLEALVADPSRIQPVALDMDVVERARTSLRQVSIPLLMYNRIKLSYADDQAGALQLDQQLGLSGDSVFVRRSGTPLSNPIPALFTRAVFDKVSSTEKLEVLSEFVGDSWVLGEGVASVTDAPRLANELMSLYEDEYIRAWEAVIVDIAPRQVSATQDLTLLMEQLAGPASPLKRLLQLIEANTNLLKPGRPATQQEASVKASITAKLRNLEKIFGPVPVAAQSGARVTQHFAPLHKLVNGPPGAAPIDQTLRRIDEIRKQLSAMGEGLGDTSALETVGAKGRLDALGQLRTEAMQLPEPISKIVAEVGSKSETLAKEEAGKELARRYQIEVAQECAQLIGGRYPFTTSGNDVALADFGRVFGSGGVFDKFFRERLAPLVDTSTDPWQWKQGAEAVGGSSSLLAQFQAVERIREIFFRPGGQMPELKFNLVPEFLDRSVRGVTVEIEGQRLDYFHGPTRSLSITWPGPSPGQSSVEFDDLSGMRPARTYQGAWSLFRMLNDAKPQAQSELRYRVTLRAGGRSVRMRLEAGSVRNPFASNVLSEFQCGAT